MNHPASLPTYTLEEANERITNQARTIQQLSEVCDAQHARIIEIKNILSRRTKEQQQAEERLAEFGDINPDELKRTLIEMSVIASTACFTIALYKQLTPAEITEAVVLLSEAYLAKQENENDDH
jgi:hypothetical protein